MITLSAGRSVVEAALGSANGFHGRVLKAPGNLVLADYMVSLARRAPTLDAAVLPALSRALIEILGATQTTGRRAGAEGRRLAFSRRERVEQHIDANLADPHLSVESIALATGMSRSSLYRLFDLQSGVGRLIHGRRLAALRSALDRREPASAQALSSRFGFADPDQMTRLFRAEFGESLDSYRVAASAAEAGGPEDSRRRWRTWLSEVA
ncbi:MAG: helix-turn-helix domain-containing protein [Brevundimonas sp.]